MKKIFFIFLCQFACAQQETRSLVTISTLKPYLTFAPRWSLGYVHKLNDRYWLGLEAGYNTAGIAIGTEESSDYRAYEIRPEIYYDLHFSERIKHFVSASVFYINKNDSYRNEGYYSGDSYYHFTSADYKRVKQGISMSYSILIPFGNSSFGFMPKMGFGVANSNIQYTNVQGKEKSDMPIDSYMLGFGDFNVTEARRTTFDFNIDVKLIYTF